MTANFLGERITVYLRHSIELNLDSLLQFTPKFSKYVTCRTVEKVL